MQRIRFVPVLLASLVLAVPVLRADVKTQQKISFKFAGTLGGVLNKFGGATTKEGLVTTSAIKGNRKLSISGDSGEIIDLGEEKVYSIDMPFCIVSARSGTLRPSTRTSLIAHNCVAPNVLATFATGDSGVGP